MTRERPGPRWIVAILAANAMVLGACSTVDDPGVGATSSSAPQDGPSTPPVEGEDGFVFDNTAVDCDAADVDGPCERGDDADLDVLWDACEAGDGSACDDLYLEAPVGSRYEQFANRCGDREDPGFSDCAGKYKI